MNNNRLLIAAAGAGKTTYLVEQALALAPETVLITTFTEANEREIRSRFVAKVGYVPSNVTIKTWFAFLLQNGVKPFQSVLCEELHNKTIGFILTSDKSGKRFDGNGKPLLFQNRPLYWGEKDFLKHYFTESLKIYSDKIAKFVCETEAKSNGAVVSRVARAFKNIFIDEVQDLAGYDLELLKLFFKSDAKLVLVGDPRQVTYLTHNTPKFGKYAEGKIKDFVENELGKKITCIVDTETLSASHRNHRLICEFSSKLYPNLPKAISCSCAQCNKDDPHNGIFLIKPQQVEEYLEQYRPLQLRWNSATKVNKAYEAMNLGESKGLTVNRVLIYPTKDMLSWLRNHNFNLKNDARAKLYVGLTRSRYSSAIVADYADNEEFDGVLKYNDQKI